jgi:hypothetical protein
MKRIPMETVLVIAIVWITIGALAADLLTANFTMPSSGFIKINVMARSGSVDDVQAAVDEAIRIGAINVEIPEGNFTFSASGSYRVNINVPARGMNIFGAGINRTVLDMPDDDTTAQTTMFSVTGLSKGRARITGITFKGRSAPGSATGDTAIQIISCKDFRVDHCSFYDMGSNGVSVQDHSTQSGIVAGDPNRVSQGVVDHCYFYDLYKAAATKAGTGYGYGVGISRAMHYNWTVVEDEDFMWNNIIGHYLRNVYVEDCYFRGCRHATTGNFGAIYVLRHCTIEDMLLAEATCTGHPVRTNTYGMQAWEVYGNVIRYTETYGTRFNGIHMEGGQGVVYNNTIQNLLDAFRFGNCEDRHNYFHPQGNVKNMFVWNNTVSDCWQTITLIDNYNNPPGGDHAPVQDVDFFLRAPLPSEANYTPYTYPHPLVSG